MNRTIMESARSMLYQSGLHVSFWAEAVSTAVYLRNRSPTSYLRDVTPYERWNKRKPNVKNLKVFGCNAFVHVPHDKRNGKLDKPSTACILVGYPNEIKGYKLYEQESKKMIRSRDVIFLEDKFKREVNKNELSELINVPATDTFQLRNDDDITVDDDDQNGDANNEVHEEPVPVEEVAARPQRERDAPDRLGAVTGEWWNFVEEASVAVSDIEEPKTIEEALSGLNSKQWSKATKKEIDSLSKKETWELVDLPSGKNIVGSKWIFKHKRDANGNINRFKARLVAQGYTQEYGLDYDEVFAPVAKYNSIRTVLAIANELDLEVNQMDVKTAFLNGDLDCEIYMNQPEGFIDPERLEMVCKLRKVFTD